MMINCIIVDDDENASAHLSEFINKTAFLNLLHIYNLPVDALSAFENGDVQLVFLDVNMPGLSGIELARIINRKTSTITPRIIFTSGFERYALEGYKVDAVDYLLKPVEYEDFINAAFKAKTIIEQSAKVPTNSDYKDGDFIFLRVEYELVRIYLKNIVLIEGFKDYIKVFVNNSDGFIKALTTMKNIEEKLPPDSFVRIHRSFIVSIDKIDSITLTMVKIGKTMIPVSNQYRESFKKFIEKRC